MAEEKYYEYPPGVDSKKGSLKRTFDNQDETYYRYPQETWDEKTCKKWSRHSLPDNWGNREPKGLINHIGSHRVEYGQVREYNGGCIREGKWYQGEIRPLPIIHEKYEFYHLTNWGLTIRLKQIKEEV